MKKYLPVIILCIYSCSAFSQRKAVGLFVTGMKHSFYETEDAPHSGYKSGFETGGGLNFSWIIDGNKEGNLRFNTLSLEFYGKITDSIVAKTFDSGSAPVIYFPGTQTTNYTFLSYEHSNFLAAEESPFLYFIVGFQLCAALNSSTYKLPGYSPSLYYLDPGDKHGGLPAKSPGAIIGLHTGMAYEFEHLFIVAKAKVEFPFFRFPEYSMGMRVAIDAGVIFPIN
jgi:hypothetical protein